MAEPEFNEIQHHKQRAFLAAYALCGNVTHAAQIAKVDRGSHYVWLNDPAYAKAIEAAREEAIERLESEARRRASEGVKKVVLHRGKPVKIDGEILYETSYSDRLLEFLLKSLRPARYRERFEHSGPEGKPLELVKVYQGIDADKV